MTIACTIIGVPRNISIYTDIIAFMILCRALRKPFLESGAVLIIPERRPIARPATVPVNAISIVYPTPWSRK